MSKRIAFCSDGTWDDSNDNTNVYIFFKALNLTPSVQYPLYDDGIGSDGLAIQRLLGGAFGTGLYRKIKDAYTRISLTYDQDDEIFLFGFSRGAYTARSLAGMIAAVGLPTKPFNDKVIDTAFQAYKERDRRAALLATLAPYGMYDAKVKMVGVWDTVGSLGIPALLGLSDPLLYGFLDTGLHPGILNAYQALAIDERRKEFPPTLWTSTPTEGQNVEQVWFAGVHSDVGGSYPDCTLSDITLGWMMEKGKALGLTFDEKVLAQYSNLEAKQALGPTHESWTATWGIPRPRAIAETANVANSVAIRCAQNASYRPANLTFKDGVLSSSYGTVPVVAPLEASTS